MKRIYNLETLVEIELCGKKENKTFKWHPEKRWFFGLVRIYPERYCNKYDTTAYVQESYLTSGKYCDIKLIVENKKVYFKPYVKLYFMGNVETCKEFDTYAEAEVFAKEIKQRATGTWHEIS